MGTAHPQSHGPHGTQLLGWIGLSVMGHVIVLSLGGGVAPVNVPFRDPLVAYIQHINQHDVGPAAVPRPEPEAETVLPPGELATPAPRPETAGIKTAPESALDLPLPFDGYFGPNDVDVRAEPANEPVLIYPWIEYRRKISGVVVITLLINERGGLDKVAVVDATPPGLFEDAALEAVNKLHFTPALKDGRPVKSRKTIDVVFDPYERINTP